MGAKRAAASTVRSRASQSRLDENKGRGEKQREENKGNRRTYNEETPTVEVVQQQNTYRSRRHLRKRANHRNTRCPGGAISPPRKHPTVKRRGEEAERSGTIQDAFTQRHVQKTALAHNSSRAARVATSQTVNPNTLGVLRLPEREGELAGRLAEAAVLTRCAETATSEAERS